MFGFLLVTSSTKIHAGNTGISQSGKLHSMLSEWTFAILNKVKKNPE